MSQKDPHPHHRPVTERALPVLIFLATLLGSLFGVAADLNDASELAVPVLEAVNPSPKLRVAGSHTILGEGIELNRFWQDEFLPGTIWSVDLPLLGQVTGHAIIEVRGVGSAAVLPDVLNSQVDLLVMTAPLPTTSLAKINEAGLEIECAAEIGYDVIAFVTDLNTKLPPVGMSDMAAILAGKMTTWDGVGGPNVPIRVLARPESATTALVMNNFLGSSAPLPHFIPCHDHTDCLNQTLSTPGALYWASTAWLRTQPPQYLRPLALRRGNQPFQNPLQADFDLNNYPAELVRPLYTYVLVGAGVPQNATELGREFVGFVRGVSGQRLLEEHYFYPHFNPPAEVALELPAGFGRQENGLPLICR